MAGIFRGMRQPLVSNGWSELSLKMELYPNTPRASMSTQPVPTPPSGTPQQGGRFVRKMAPDTG